MENNAGIYYNSIVGSQTLKECSLFTKLILYRKEIFNEKNLSSRHGQERKRHHRIILQIYLVFL